MKTIGYLLVVSLVFLLGPMASVHTSEDITSEKLNLLGQYQDLVNVLEAQSGVEDISLYYQNMVTGEQFVINGEIYYNPASMAKLALLWAAVFRLDEQGQDFLHDLVLVPTVDYSLQPDEFDDPMTPGSYTVAELIERTIVDSDNNAKNYLSSYLGPTASISAARKLGIKCDREKNGKAIFNCTELGTFFSKLMDFKSVNVSAESRNYALQLLQRADDFEAFNVTSCTQRKVLTAQKYGLAIEGPVHTLHDGTIAVSIDGSYTYTLVVSLRGSDTEQLQNALGMLSGISCQYHEVELYATN